MTALAVVACVVLSIAAARRPGVERRAGLARDAVVLQRSDNDCGVAAVGTLVSLTGRGDGAALARRVEVRGAGLSLLEVARLAKSWGIDARPVFVNPASGAVLRTPWIAHVRTRPGHYVVVERIEGRTWIVADPARGLVRYAELDFRRRWSGYALVLNKPTATAQ